MTDNPTSAHEVHEVYFVRGAFRPESDAVARSIVELAISLQKRGRSVRIVSWTPPGSLGMHDKLAPGTIVSLAPAKHGDNYQSAHRIAFLLMAGAFLAKNARRGSSVITLDDPTGLGVCLLPLRMLRRGVKHFVYLMDLQSVQYLRLRQGSGLTARANRLRGQIDKFTWRSADAVVVLGECMRTVVSDLESRARIRVVPIWQDSTRIHGVDGTFAKAELNLSDKFVILYHGHATYRQPMDVLVQAAEKLRDNPRFQFVVAGGGASIEWLAEQVDSRKLSNVQINAKVTGMDMLSILSMADVHVAILDDRATGTCVPSKTYTAMAVGRPCIYVGNPSGQAAIDLDDSSGGYVVPDGEGSQFLSMLESLADDEEERHQMGQRALKYFLRERDLAQAVDRWEDLLRT